MPEKLRIARYSHFSSRNIQFAFAVIIPQKQGTSSEASPSLVHRISIAAPSKRWTIDGVSMDYRWTILGLRRELLGRSNGFTYISLFYKKHSEKGKKNPTRSRSILGGVGRILIFLIIVLANTHYLP